MLSRAVAPEGTIMPKKYIEKVGDEEFRKKPIGSGPWKFVRNVPGDRIGPLLRGADRAGAVLAVGADRDQALARAARAAELIWFRVISPSVLPA